METIDIAAMQAHCDQLTRDGQELSVRWEGGNDSGWLYLNLDGNELDNLKPIEEQIIQFLENHLGYDSFAGDFSTSGTVVYDPEGKCFVGEDNYYETDEAVAECAINISLPDNIWFDRIILRINMNRSHNRQDTSLTLQVFNGPHPDYFDEIEVDLIKDINTQFLQACKSIKDWAGIREEFILDHKDFRLENGKLRYLINRFDYFYHEYDDKEIYISFAE